MTHLIAPPSRRLPGDGAGAALRGRWFDPVVSLAEGAAASLSPSLCSGGGMMDPRNYIKVGSAGLHPHESIVDVCVR